MIQNKTFKLLFFFFLFFISLDNVSATYTTTQIKDPIYEEIKKSGKFSYRDVFIQTNKFKKPIMNAPLPTKMPTDNRLVIPSIQMNLKIIEGKSLNSISHGAWRVFDSSTPDKGGNTVIVGHRISTVGGINKPWDFFYLPEVKKGQFIDVYWKGKRYTYQVYKESVEDPENSDIEDQTKNSILTIYTCYPLWTYDYRYAIQAKLVEVSDKVRIK